LTAGVRHGRVCRVPDAAPLIIPDPVLAAPSEARRFVLAVDPSAPPPGLEGAIAAIGNFDGIHRGHKAVIQRAKALADASGRPSALLTFEPHPSDYFGGPGTIFRLTPMPAKAKLIERLGLAGMIVLPFDARMATMAADDFISDILVRRLGFGGIVAGYDFHFGRMRTGTPDLLKTRGAALGLPVEIVDRIEADEAGVIEAASSTATRVALEAGDVSRASRLLGHPYSIAGCVVGGQRLGRTLGFPTANIVPDPSCRLRHGIYAVRVEVDGEVYDGVASFGRRPTVDDGPPLLEVFLFDFDRDIYGKLVDVTFIEWLRAEERFDGLESLRAQIARDEAQARRILQRA
jgi:riboflavin kinase / FMN adenylyltransferase